MPVELVWFKKDLRVVDHPALSKASEVALERGNTLCCVYLYEDSIINAEDFSRRHLLFINDCLRELGSELNRKGQRLLLLRDEAVAAFSKLHVEYQISTIWSHEETGNDLSYKRDKDVAQWCKQSGVDWIELPQNGVIRRLTNRDGWSRQWVKRMKQEIPRVPESLPKSPDSQSCEILGPEIFGLASDGERHLQLGGTQAGLECLESFLSERGMGYTREMSSPVVAFDSCSRISPYLTYGALSIRQAYQIGDRRQKALRELDSSEPSLKSWKSALKSFMGRLRWHCHFIQKLEDEPSLEFRNLFRSCDGLRENEWNETYYHAWVSGKTGYPMVDACMRALTAIGWMNFRMRAMLMSFASYHLWLHWRKTGLHLARLFTDYEPGIHWSQTQMQSGTTGINSIRVYSPTKQALDQDPDGVFIREWIPELRNVPQTYITEPWKMPDLEQSMCHCRIGEDYPGPIVDHATVYRSAQKRIRSVRGSDEAKKQRQRIYRKHGSRRRPREVKPSAV
ncbi:MAG: FAD-binding domain-containing protein [Verrucomicrobiota bacterium]